MKENFPNFFITAVFGFLFFSKTLLSASHDPKLVWKTVETPHFAIHFAEGSEKIAQKMQRVTEEVYDNLSQKFDARPWGRTQVVITDDDDQANGLATVIPYNFIVIRAVPPTSNSSLANYDDWLKTLFTHEYTHVIHLSDTRYPAKALKLLFGKIVAPNALTPGWVIEGLATSMETSETSGGRGRASYTDMLLRTDILQNKFLKLDQMNGTQMRWPSWMAQYLYGVGFWNYLESTYGQEKILQFSHKYGASLRFFFLSAQSKKIFKDEKGRGKSFQELWKDWKASLEAKYAKVRERVEKEGVVEGDEFLKPKKDEHFSVPTFSPDGRRLIYMAMSLHHSPELRLRDLDSGKEKILLKKVEVDRLSFSPDGSKIIFSAVKSYKTYQHVSDLWEIDLTTLKSKQITHGKRARDPEVSSDGSRVLAVLQKTGYSVLGIYDPKEKTWKECSQADSFDHPTWLNDNELIVSAQRHGERNLWRISSCGKEAFREKQLTRGISLDSDPLVDVEKGKVYFTSDSDGISNLYEQDLSSGKRKRLTNVLTGIFQPTKSPNGDMVFQYYTGEGFELRKLNLSNVTRPLFQEDPSYARPLMAEERSSPEEVFQPKKYNPFKTLFVPRYVLPSFTLVDGSVFLSAMIENHDPLMRHQWNAFVNYRSDNPFWGFGGQYLYNRFRLPVFVGFNDYEVNYGNIFGTGYDFFEERRRVYTGFSFPWSKHRLSLNYFFENRSAEAGLPSGVSLETLGHYAGIQSQYSYQNISGTRGRISPETGSQLKVNFEISQKALGSSSSLEQRVVWGDARKYLRVPGTQHHVLALRAAGGTSFGDPFLQGNFSLGGSLGEGPFSSSSTRLFTLRGLPLGTFSKDSAWVASAEYRLPLFRLERGPGLFPLSLNTAHMAFFTDVGDAFNHDQSKWRPLVAVGAELRGDFILGYHLPMMGRLGYGIVLTHRERFAGLEDSLTGFDARNGVVVLEIGTSF